MKNELLEVERNIRSLSDDRLLQMLASRREYRVEAIEIAEDEKVRRGIVEVPLCQEVENGVSQSLNLSLLLNKESESVGKGTIPPAHCLSTTAEVGSLFWGTLLVSLGHYLILPSPWVATGFCKWFVGHIRLPHQIRLTFVGNPADMISVLLPLSLCTYANLWIITTWPCKDAAINYFLPHILIPLISYLALLFYCWVVSNLAVDGIALPLKFTGSYWAMVVWAVLKVASLSTIVGWAWVATAYQRWFFRHIEGTNTKIVFVGTGIEYLWRTVVLYTLVGFPFVFLCFALLFDQFMLRLPALLLGVVLIFNIPWTLHWYVRWFMSRLVLESRTHVHE